MRPARGRDQSPGDEPVRVQFSLPSLWPGPPPTSQAPTGASSPWVHSSFSCTRPRYLTLHSWLEMTFSGATLRTELFPVPTAEGMGGREGGCGVVPRPVVRGPRPAPRTVLPLVSPQPAISHLVPGGTTYCSGGKQIRATRWFRVTGLRQKRGCSGPEAERPGPPHCPRLGTHLSSLSRSSWESEGPHTILATGTRCRPGSWGCGFWNMVPSHTS